jgi:hypothetical protein
MKRKNIVYLIALVVVILGVLLLLGYKPNLKYLFQNIEQSKPLAKTTSAVYAKLNEPAKHSVPAKLNEPNVSDVFSKVKSQSPDKSSDPEIIKESLNSLVVDKYDGVNEQYIDEEKPYMEFSFLTPPQINIASDTADYHELSYQLTSNLNESRGGNLNLLKNTSVFDTSLGGRSTVDIFFEYSDDYRKDERERYLKQTNSPSELEYIAKNYGKETRLSQGVKFFMWDVKFNQPLKMPQNIIIWNEYSKDIFTCFINQNTFVHAGASYTSEYICPKLPNFNDYGGSLKIIFDQKA